MNKSPFASAFDAVSISPSQQLAVSRFMSRAYGWMTLGLALTATISFALASSEDFSRVIVENRGLFLLAIFAEFGLVLWLTAAFQRLSSRAAILGFLAYSCLNGVTFSVIFLAYSLSMIGQVFMITAGMFAGLALYGTVTRRNLSSLGAFVGMGLWGLILVSLVNLFVRSESLSMGVAAAGVLIFSGLTAHHAQAIRGMAYRYATSSGDSLDERKGPVFAALSLYLNFVNLFLSLLRLAGGRRN